MTEDHILCHNVTGALEGVIKQIDRRLEKLSALWEEYKDRPWLGRKALGRWKDRTVEILHEFSPDDADYFERHVYGKPYNEIEDEDKREHKIFESEVQVYKVHLTCLRDNYEDRLNSLLVKEAEKQEPSPTEDSTGGKARQRPKGKRGRRSRYSRAEKDDVVMEWERRGRESTAQTLVDFLVEKFGDNEDWKPLVASSTFYDWRTDFYKRNPDWQPDKP